MTKLERIKLDIWKDEDKLAGDATLEIDTEEPVTFLLDSSTIYLVISAIYLLAERSENDPH